MTAASVLGVPAVDPTVPSVPKVAEEVITTADRVVEFLLGAPARIVGIVLVAMLARWLAHKLIREAVDRAVASSLHERLAVAAPGRLLLDAGGGLLAERRRQRLQTIGTVLRSVASIVIFAVALGTILGELGVNLGPLLASAGIVGAALGFGAQNLVRDFLSGAAIIVEDQYGVGDTVDFGPGSVAGTVEAVGLRVTRLRDEQGVVWYVRNGEILRVGNRDQGWTTAQADVPVAHGQDLHAAQSVLRRVASELTADPQWADRVLALPPPLVGLQALAPDAITLRIEVRCPPITQLDVQRELRARAVQAFAAAGIRMTAADPEEHEQPAISS